MFVSSSPTPKNTSESLDTIEYKFQYLLMLLYLLDNQLDPTE